MPLVTTSVKMPVSLSAGRILLSSRWRTIGSPPTSETCSGLCLRTRLQDAVDQLIAAAIVQFAERDAAAKMRVAVSVAAGAAQRDTRA